MENKQYMEEFIKTTTRMIDIVGKKNKDYATDTNAFKSFGLCETLGICNIEQGILVRMSDKFSRISNLLNHEENVKDEKINDTLIDLANYAIILSIYLESKKERGN